jgi:hypothetical protein
LFLQKNNASFPDDQKTLGMPPVFLSNQFIIKGHYQPEHKLECQRGPGDNKKNDG